MSSCYPYQFKRESHNGTIFYILLPIERLSDALKVLNSGFYPYETACMCIEVAKNAKAVAELNELSKECIKDGVSIVAVEKATNQIIGVSVNKIQKKNEVEGPSFFEKFIQICCKENESIALIRFMIQCDSHVDFFEHYGTNKLMEVMFVAVLPSHTKRGIGFELVQSDLQLMNELTTNFNGPDIATALFTSSYSQKIGEKLQFDHLKTIPLNLFEYNSVKYSHILKRLHSETTGIQVKAKRALVLEK